MKSSDSNGRKVFPETVVIMGLEMVPHTESDYVAIYKRLATKYIEKTEPFVFQKPDIPKPRKRKVRSFFASIGEDKEWARLMNERRLKLDAIRRRDLEALEEVKRGLRVELPHAARCPVEAVRVFTNVRSDIDDSLVYVIAKAPVLVEEEDNE